MMISIFKSVKSTQEVISFHTGLGENKVLPFHLKTISRAVLICLCFVHSATRISFKSQQEESVNTQTDSNIITQAKLDDYIDDAGNTAVTALDLMFFISLISSV